MNSTDSLPVVTVPCEEEMCRAFVDGAKWWEWMTTGFTMWSSDRAAAYRAAELKYRFPGEPWPPDDLPTKHPDTLLLDWLLSHPRFDGYLFRSEIKEAMEIEKSGGLG